MSNTSYYHSCTSRYTSFNDSVYDAYLDRIGRVEPCRDYMIHNGYPESVVITTVVTERSIPYSVRACYDPVPASHYNMNAIFAPVYERRSSQNYCWKEPRHERTCRYSNHCMKRSQSYNSLKHENNDYKPLLNKFNNQDERMNKNANTDLKKSYKTQLKLADPPNHPYYLPRSRSVEVETQTTPQELNEKAVESILIARDPQNDGVGQDAEFNRTASFEAKEPSTAPKPKIDRRMITPVKVNKYVDNFIYDDRSTPIKSGPTQPSSSKECSHFAFDPQAMSETKKISANADELVRKLNQIEEDETENQIASDSDVQSRSDQDESIFGYNAPTKLPREVDLDPAVHTVTTKFKTFTSSDNKDETADPEPEFKGTEIRIINAPEKFTMKFKTSKLKPMMKNIDLSDKKTPQSIKVPLKLDFSRSIKSKPKPMSRKRSMSAIEVRAHSASKPDVARISSVERVQFYKIKTYLDDKHCITKHPDTFLAFAEKFQALKTSQKHTSYKREITKKPGDKKSFWKVYDELQARKKKRIQKAPHYEKSTVASIAKII